MNRNLLHSAASQIQCNAGVPPKTHVELNPQAKKLVNQLFEALMAIKPAWRQMIPDDKELAIQKAHFVKGFIENGICTPEQVAHGVKQARRDPSDFFPSVGRFISWCQPDPEELGLPDLEAAYQEAANHSSKPSRHRWSHPAVYHAGKIAGWHELRSEQRNKTYPLFKSSYMGIIERVLKGERFELPDRFDATKLEHHTGGKKVMTEESKAAGRETLNVLKKAVGI
jgi:hypothetical protein